MRASVIREFGKPWTIEEQPLPQLAAGQVLIRVAASGFCGTDVHLHHGELPVQAPITAGHQPVGEVVDAATDVTSVRVGDRVAVPWFQKGCGRCEWCKRGRITHCKRARTWINTGGGHAEYVRAWADGCMLVADDVPAELAAPMLCAGFTVTSGFRRALPQPGDRVAVVGFGALGHLALQIAHALGHDTLVVTSAAKCDDARAMGADTVLPTADHVGDVLRHAGGADIIMSCTPKAVDVSRAMSGLRPGGRLVNAGFVDGPIAVDVYDLTFAQTSLVGTTMDRRADLALALELVRAGKVRPWVQTFPLEAHNDVREAVAAGKVRYCAVLVP
jgi:D-arabinose 1-dehydrogenase-like Zn-dependent alcohol dehydrogenase